MDPYIVLLTGLGVVILAIAWLPMLLRNAPLSGDFASRGAVA